MQIEWNYANVRFNFMLQVSDQLSLVKIGNHINVSKAIINFELLNPKLISMFDEIIIAANWNNEITTVYGNFFSAITIPILLYHTFFIILIFSNTNRMNQNGRAEWIPNFHITPSE